MQDENMTTSANPNTNSAQSPAPQTVDPIASEPKPVSTIPSETQPETTPIMEYAGFWIRLVAALIDGFILGIVGSIIQAIFSGLIGASLLTTQSIDPTANAGLFVVLFGTAVLVNIGIQVAYFVGLTGVYGATVGKMILGLKVVDTNGQKIGFGKVALREIVGKWISGLVLGLGYLWVAFDDKKQGWHDKIAGTLVIKTR